MLHIPNNVNLSVDGESLTTFHELIMVKLIDIFGVLRILLNEY
jgi:hypothetical protein